MRVTPVDHGLNLLQSVGTRSDGLHISDLYNSYYQASDPKRYKSDGAPNIIKMALGLAWEAYLERCLIASGVNAERPGEFTTDEGIAFSPDLLIVNGQDRGGEIKLTYMSESDALDDPKFMKWHSQMMLYGHHLGLNQWRMYALYINGDYKKQRDPVLRAYDIEYSAREMREEWQTMCRHGRQRRLL